MLSLLGQLFRTIKIFFCAFILTCSVVFSINEILLKTFIHILMFSLIFLAFIL